MYGLIRDAHPQASVNTSCRHKAFVLASMWWKSPMATGQSWQNFSHSAGKRANKSYGEKTLWLYVKIFLLLQKELSFVCKGIFRQRAGFVLLFLQCGPRRKAVKTVFYTILFIYIILLGTEIRNLVRYSKLLK